MRCEQLLTPADVNELCGAPVELERADEKESSEGSGQSSDGQGDSSNACRLRFGHATRGKLRLFMLDYRASRSDAGKEFQGAKDGATRYLNFEEIPGFADGAFRYSIRDGFVVLKAFRATRFLELRSLPIDSTGSNVPLCDATALAKVAQRVLDRIQK